MSNVLDVIRLLLFLVLVSSCADRKWDLYDEAKPRYLDEGSLFEFLNGKPEFSEFIGLVKKCGYDSVLRRTDLMTVLVVKNGGFKDIDTNDIVKTRSLIGMHILRSAVYKENMDNQYILSVNGKYVNFQTGNGTITANSIHISTEGEKLLNGVCYVVDDAIEPLYNLREVIAANPEFSMFREYIDNSYDTIIDPDRNVIIGYDEKDQPIYQEPVIYRTGSSYLEGAKLDDEGEQSTAFIPTNAVIEQALSKLLSARAGQNGLLVPKLGTNHGDTTIGYFYVPRNIAYPGDSAILKDYLFKNMVTAGKVASVPAGDSYLISRDNHQLAINAAQLRQTQGSKASNGFYYVLDGIGEVIPGDRYRKTFVFDPTVANPIDYRQAVINPDIVFFGGASSVTTLVPQGGAPASGGSAKKNSPIHERAREFNLTNVGGGLSFVMPFMTKGKYKALFSIIPLNTGTGNAAAGCILKFLQEDVVKKENMNTSAQFSTPLGVAQQPSVDIEIPDIVVDADGPAHFSLICTAPGPINPGYRFTMCSIKFVPVE